MGASRMHPYLESIGSRWYVDGCDVRQRTELSVGVIFQKGDDGEDSVRVDQDFEFIG